MARDRIGSFYQVVEQLFQQAGFALHARHVIDHPQTTMALVAAGAGVSLVPVSYNNVKRPGIVYRSIKPPVRVNMIVAWRPDNRSSDVREFLATVSNQAGD